MRKATPAGRLSRRDLLRAAGGAAALFPFVAGRAEAGLPPTPRLVLLMQTNGTSQANFWPTPPAPGTPAPANPAARLHSPILAPLATDPTLVNQMTVVKGLRNEAGGAGNGHDQGFCGLYSGYRPVGSFNDPWGNGISIDQDLRQRLSFAEPFPTLNCGVRASDTPPFKAHRKSFSYKGAGLQVPAEIDPYRLYARYFAATWVPAGVDPVLAAQQRLLRRQSVLDAVNADLGSLRPRLGHLDRRKLADHETALRELEKRLAATLNPVDQSSRPAHCGGITAPAHGIDVRAEDNVPKLCEMMFDFIALALGCQQTRIVTFQFGNGGEKWYYRWLGINENSHDDIAHRDHGTDAAVTSKVVAINVWHAQMVAHLGRALSALPDGPGRLLDNTLVVWGNELATGPHGMLDLPLVLLGGAAGRLPPGGRLVDAGPQQHHRLGTSLLNLMGVPAAGFGEAPAAGPLLGL